MKMAALLLTSIAAIWAVWVYVLHPDIILSYRLTAEVKLQGKTYSGSAVIQVRWSETLVNPLGLADIWSKRAKGEAVVVDLAENGIVLVTLAGYPQQEPELLPQMVFDTQGDITALRKYLTTLSRDKRVATVKPDRVPVVIWLKDRLDPSSAACIEPNGAQDSVDMPSFPHVQMQMVDEPATERIYTVLPWLRSMLEPNPAERGNVRFIDSKRRFPQRLCFCAPLNLKTNRL